MPTIQLPNNWKPRAYQRPAWDYLERGGKHCELVWHRRSGKDELGLHRTAVAAFERVSGYWYMLPQYTQARKAIWDAINPHSGKRRIDEVFPPEIRANTRNQEMMIVFKNGSSWQVVGSDNPDSLVGAPPAGIVYSEWALSNPSVRGYMHPIIMENNGWQIFNGTPRGRNHAYRTYQGAKSEPNAFAQRLTAADTGVFTDERLEEARLKYIEDYGHDVGESLYRQEYYCDWDAAIMGAFYGRELADASQQKRIREVEYDPAIPVHAVFDLGMSDDTTILWFQMIGGEVHILKGYSTHGQPIKHYVDVLNDTGYKYPLMGNKPHIWLPHDARAKTFAANGKSAQQQFEELGYRSYIVPGLSVQDGIQAVRHGFPRFYIDEVECADMLDAVAQYQREWDDEKKCFRDKPRHDWTSHFADALRYLSIVWQEAKAPKAPQPARFDTDLQINEIIKRQREKRLQEA